MEEYKQTNYPNGTLLSSKVQNEHKDMATVFVITDQIKTQTLPPS